MKAVKYLTVFLLGAAVVFALFLTGEFGFAGGPLARENGDVNGDSTIDLSDVIYLLRYLFSGGPAPVPLRPKGGPLPATGLRDCFSYSPAQPIPCVSQDYPGQDGHYQAGCPMEGRFVDNGDGTVTDTCTGLMWQKGIGWDKDGDGDVDSLGWEEALWYCENLILCNDGTWTTDPARAEMHGGVKYDDWRLPNFRELESIKDYGGNEPGRYKLPRPFEGWWSWYWSSTVLRWPAAPIAVYFGPENYLDRRCSTSDPIFVRAVRTP